MEYKIVWHRSILAEIRGKDLEIWNDSHIAPVKEMLSHLEPELSNSPGTILIDHSSGKTKYDAYGMSDDLKIKVLAALVP